MRVWMYPLGISALILCRPPAVQQSSKRDLRFRLSLESLAIERYLLPIALVNKSRVEGCTQTVPPFTTSGPFTRSWFHKCSGCRWYLFATGEHAHPSE